MTQTQTKFVTYWRYPTDAERMAYPFVEKVCLDYPIEDVRCNDTQTLKPIVVNDNNGICYYLWKGS